jgi:hypothetical protein
MPPKNVHVIPHDERWASRVEGNGRVSSAHATKAEVRAAGRGRAQRNQFELLVHRREGVITERSSFGRDPYQPRG